MKTTNFIVLVLVVSAALMIAGCTTTPPTNVTPTVTVTSPPAGNVTVTATTAAPGIDLTNQNSPLAATFSEYPSRTPLNAPKQPVGLKFVAGNLTAPSMIVSANDGTGRLFIVEQTGIVRILMTNGTVLPNPFLDVRDRMITPIASYDERGLLSIAFHPDYAQNGRVFAYYSAPLRSEAEQDFNCTNHLSEFRVSTTDPNRVNLSTEKILLYVDKPYTNHNGGWILFGPSDGYLYLPLGDGGRADDTGIGHTNGTGNAQDLSKILGKVIRIDVNNQTGGKLYAIPPDNPFVGNAAIPPEIYAYGFRNPAYAAFDSGDDNHLFIAMAGQRLFESVFIVLKGGNYGWNIREGTHCFDPNNNVAPPNASCRATGYQGESLIGPVVELGHDVGNTIIGGALYRGTGLSGWQGKYVFGTWSNESRLVGNGTLLVATPPSGFDLASLPADATALTPDQNRMWTTQEIQVANNKNGRINAFVRAINEGPDHELYLLLNKNGGPGLQPQGSGEVWMFVSANTTGLEDTDTRIAPATTVMTTTTTRSGSSGGGY